MGIIEESPAREFHTWIALKEPWQCLPDGGLTARAPARPDDFTDMPVKNQPPFKFTTNTLEARATQGAKEHTGQEGQNSGGFENRATQEGGTH